MAHVARVRPGNVARSESFVCVYPEGNVIKWGFNWNSQNIFKEFTKTINEYLQYLLKLYEQFTEVDHLHTNRIMNGPCPFLRIYSRFNYFQSLCTALKILWRFCDVKNLLLSCRIRTFTGTIVLRNPLRRLLSITIIRVVIAIVCCSFFLNTYFSNTSEQTHTKSRPNFIPDSVCEWGASNRVENIYFVVHTDAISNTRLHVKIQRFSGLSVGQPKDGIWRKMFVF